ncbi:MAG TPA: PEGA domain-containing protein [Thermoanaerobaculia bacterium]
MRISNQRNARRALAATLAAALLGAGVAPASAAATEATVAASSAEQGTTAVTARHRTRSHTRIYVRPRLTTSWHVGWGPYWGPYWGGYWGGYWDGYGYGPRLGYPRVYPQPGAVYGALDTDLSPERAEVWVDGERVGVADDFDGFPDYLWLEKGTYDVVFYLPGFKTIARQYSIYPGLVLDAEDRMERGESVLPSDLGPASHERRDARLERDRELRERVAAEERDLEADETEGETDGGDYLDARAEPGRLRLRVEPADASVYLDGRFLGTGDDLAGLRAGLLVDSGSHRLEIVRPGYRSVERTVEVDVGEETVIAVELDAAEADG